MGSTEDASSPKKAKLFCARTFRKEISEGDFVKSVREFNNLANSKIDQDVVQEYLEAGGSVQELLSLLDVTAKHDLTSALPVLKATNFILMKIQSMSSNYQQQTDSGLRYMFHSFLPTMKAMLTMKNDKHRKVILKLLTSAVTLNSSFGREILASIPLPPTLIKELTEVTPGSDTVRKCFIFFILSFLLEESSFNIQSLIGSKDLIGCITDGLIYDEATTVNMVLRIFKEKILEKTEIRKITKLEVFNTQIIKSLIEVYNWKGPQNINKKVPGRKAKFVKEVEINAEEKEVVLSSLQEFLIVLCTSKKYGIAFSDKTYGSSGKNHNQLILTALEALPEPWTRKETSELYIRILESCPDLVKASLNRLGPYLEPRKSAMWIKSFQFLEDVLKSFDAPVVLKNSAQDLSTNQVTSVARWLCCPPVLLIYARKGVDKAQPLVIQYYSLRLLILMWNLAQKLLKSMDSGKNQLQKMFYRDFTSHLPSTNYLTKLWHKICQNALEVDDSLENPEISDFLMLLVNSLEMINVCQPDCIVSPYTISNNMMNSLDGLDETLLVKNAKAFRIAVLKFLIAADSSCLTPDTELFEKSLVTLLGGTETSFSNVVGKILLGTGLFENNPSEIEIWLSCFYSLPEEYKDDVSRALVEALRKGLVSDVEISQGKSQELGNTSNIESVFSELMNESQGNKKTRHRRTDSTTLTPLIVHFLEVVHSYSLNSKKSKSRKRCAALCTYLKGVIVHLSHSRNRRTLVECCQKYERLLSPSLWTYLENSFDSEISNDFFITDSEKNLYKYFMDPKCSVDIASLLTAPLNNLHLFLLFRMTIFYLSETITSNQIVESDVKKFREVILHIIEQADRTEENEVEEDSKLAFASTFSSLRNQYICSLFTEEALLNAFDAFERKSNSKKFCTDIIASVMSNVQSRVTSGDLSVDELLVQPWKEKLLQHLISRVNRKKIVYTDNLNDILNFFKYNSLDIAQVLDGICDADIGLLATSREFTTWCQIFIKFLKLECDQNEISEKSLKGLCNVVEHLSKTDVKDLKNLDECLLYIIQKCPDSLCAISEDFLSAFIQRRNVNEYTIKCGKSFLSEPRKVKFILQRLVVSSNCVQEWKLILPMISALIVKERAFYSVMKQFECCLLWSEEELKKDENSEFSKLLKNIYKDLKPDILKTLSGEKVEHILDHLDFVCILIRLFTDEKEAQGIVEETASLATIPELGLAVLKKFPSNNLHQKFILELTSQLCELMRQINLNSEEFWSRQCCMVGDMFRFLRPVSTQKITKSPKWKEFIRLTLRLSIAELKFPSLMKLLRIFIDNFYEIKSKSKDVGEIFEMVTTHSEFFNVALRCSPLKEELFRLLTCLVTKNKSVASEKHIPVLLAAYNASLSSCDQVILNLLRIYEKLGIDVTQYEPLVWSSTAVSHYSIRSNSGLTLWRRMSMLSVLNLFDAKKVKKTITEFPFQRSSEGVNVTLYNEKDIYDPAFFLPLFSNLLSPGSVTYCQQFVFKGALALTICSLSSKCPNIRSLAAVVLSRFYNHFELIPNSQPKSVWLHLVDSIRFSMENLANNPIPSVFTIFLARTTQELTEPLSEMFSPLRNYILAKPFFDFDRIPEFIPLFFSSDVNFERHREWILQVMRDSIKDDTDFQIALSHKSPKYILSLFQSRLCKGELKVLILEVLTSLMKTEKSFVLLSQSALLTWMSQASEGVDGTQLEPFVKFFSAVTCAFTQNYSNSTKAQAIASSQVSEIVKIAFKVLRLFQNWTFCDAFTIFLKSFHKFLLFCLQRLERGSLHLCRLEQKELISTGTQVLKKTSAFWKSSKLHFYFNDLELQDSVENLFVETIFLCNVLLK